jgi:hypothetical protein
MLLFCCGSLFKPVQHMESQPVQHMESQLKVSFFLNHAKRTKTRQTPIYMRIQYNYKHVTIAAASLKELWKHRRRAIVYINDEFQESACEKCGEQLRCSPSIPYYFLIILFITFFIQAIDQTIWSFEVAISITHFRHSVDFPK